MAASISNNQRTDSFARLLANENIIVQRANVSTASFDIVNRVLTLPTWKNVPVETEQMLVLHEVGHALLTNYDECKEIFEGELKYLKSYVNIIEDARIERLMKLKYPGSKKTFFDGYAYLLKEDFFDLRYSSVNKLNFIDRINLYFKVGSQLHVNFSNDEKIFVDRIGRVSSVTEAIQLAKEVYEFSKSRPSQHGDDLTIAMFSSSEEDDDAEQSNFFEDYESDEESDDVEGEEDTDCGAGGSIGQDVNEDLESRTDSALSRRLSDYCDTDTVYRYFEPKFEMIDPAHNNIISFKRIIKDFNASSNLKYHVNRNKSEYNAFTRNTNLTVSYLIKEFEMKKAASSYKRQQQSKTGMINARKLYQYQLNNDIFRQITKIQEEKGHTMTFLLDWSGSMSLYMEETIAQLLALVTFCRRIRIPFNVFAFSDAFVSPKMHVAIQCENGLGSNTEFALLELFSDKMNSQEFAFMCESLYSKPWVNVRGKYALNGTPLNHALVYCIDYIGKFIKERGTEKNSLIVLTDGEGECLNNSQTPVMFGKRYEHRIGTTQSYRSYMRDPITKKEYKISNNDPVGMTSALLDIIRSRYGVKVIRFFVTPASVGRLKTFMVRNNIDQNLVSVTDELTKKLRREGYLQIDGVDGVDKMFSVNANVKIYDDDFDVTNEMSARQISTQLKNSMQKSRTSRVLLSRFIDEIA